MHRSTASAFCRIKCRLDIGYLQSLSIRTDSKSVMISAKRYRWARLFLLGFLVLLADSGRTSVVWAAEPIRLGAVFSVTAKSGFAGPLVGAPMKGVVTAAVAEVNRKGGVLGRQVELFVEDDQSSPTEAAVVATKLIRDKRVAAIIGPSLTDSAMSMMPVCEKEQVPMVVTGPVVSPFKKWIFLLGSGDVRGAEHIAEFAVKTLRAKRIAVFNDSANYGTTGMRNLQRDIPRLGGAIVVEEAFGPSDTNMVPQLSNIKAANPDLMILYATGASAAVVAKNYRQLGMAVRVLGSHGVPTPQFLKLAGKTAEEHGWVMIGSTIAIASELPPSDPYRKVYDGFLALMKGKRIFRAIGPNVYQAGAYDGIMVTIRAIEAAGTDDRSAVRDALERIRWNGLVGPFACTATDHQGSPRDTSSAMVIKGGKYVPYPG